MCPPEVDMETVEQLRRLLEAATPGPWVQTQEIDGIFSGRQTVIKAGSDDSPAFPYRRVVTVGQTRQHFHIEAEDNVALIAAMHAALPALLDIAEAAQAVEAGDVDALLHIGGPVEHRGDLYDTPGCFDVMGDYQEDARYILPARDKLIDQALRAALSRLDTEGGT